MNSLEQTLKLGLHHKTHLLALDLKDMSVKKFQRPSGSVNGAWTEETARKYSADVGPSGGEKENQAEEQREETTKFSWFISNTTFHGIRYVFEDGSRLRR